MSDNTFWILFWIIVFCFFSITSYFEEQTKQIEIKTDLKIKEMKNDSDKELRESMERITNSVKEIIE